MNKRVLGSLTGVVAVVVCLGTVGAASGSGSPQATCQALMNKVGEQAKAVVRAENSVNVAQKAYDDCLVEQKRAKQQNKKVDCTLQQTELKKRKGLLKAEQDKLAVLQKDYNAKCGK